MTHTPPDSRRSKTARLLDAVTHSGPGYDPTPASAEQSAAAPSAPELEPEWRQQLADQIRTNYRDLRFFADQLAVDLMPVVRAAVADAQARIKTLEHVARGNRRHVQILVPEIDRLTARAEQAEARVRELEGERDGLKQRLHDAAMTKTWTNADAVPSPLAADDAPETGAVPGVLMLCSFCAAENHSSDRSCGFCNIDFRDLEPRTWVDTQPASDATIPRSPGPDECAMRCYGVAVLDAEDGAFALTDDPRRAMAAIHAFYRITGGELNKHDWKGFDPARHLVSGWMHLEDRDGGCYGVHSDREHDVDVPVIQMLIP